MDENSPIFRCLGHRTFEATAAAVGPWDERHCHGGAPAALLASALEETTSPVQMDVARFTVDLIRPVPVGERLRVEIREGRQGKRVQLLESALAMGDRILARATALKVRAQPATAALPAADGPDPSRRRPMPAGFSGGFTIVPVAGGFGEPGPADVWFRLDSPLLAGASPSALVRCVAAADFGSGIAHELDFESWQFPSLDLTVGLARMPAGPWIRLQSRWLDSDGGRTACVTALGDVHGPFGEAVQTVFLEPRPHQ